MRNDRVIELGLGPEQAARRHAEALRVMLDQSVAVLRDALTVYAESAYDGCCGELDACRIAVADGTDVGTLAARLTPCLDAGREAVADMRAKQQERRKELAALVALVREAVSAAGIEHNSLRSSLNQSLDRFEAVGQFGDLYEIKTHLAAEVRAMKQAMAERLQGWESRVGQLGERVAMLESELLTSRHEASLDPLTHVANRRTFDRTCREWTKTATSGFVLAIFDVDAFKAINDALGHAAGDRALVAVAQTLKASVRSEDLAARLGGDEFVALIADLTLRQAEVRLRNVLTAISAATSASVSDGVPMVTVSCGAAEFSAGDTPASLVQRADEALYEAKRAGKNRVVTKARPYLSDLMKRR